MENSKKGPVTLYILKLSNLNKQNYLFLFKMYDHMKNSIHVSVPTILVWVLHNMYNDNM